MSSDDDTAAENGHHSNNHHHHHQKKSKPNPEQTLITPTQIQSEFSHHHPTVARINNGSFGCCPATIIAAQHDWQLRLLRQPDSFHFSLLRPSIDLSRRLLLPLLNAPSLSSLSLVDNATTATSIVLHFLSRRLLLPGDSAVVLHHAYGSVKVSARAFLSRSAGHVIEVPLPFPVYSSSDIIAEFRRALNHAKSNNRRVRLAVIDHITSMPSVVLPVKDLVRICREEGVDKVFVDGAHAIGSVDVDLQEIGADFYVSNLHKWFFCPPSAAVLYCRPSPDHDDVHHPVVSHEYGNGLPAECTAIGTRDFTSQLVVPEVFEFVRRFEGGLGGIMKRNHEKVVEMGEMLVKSWGTHLGSAPDLCAGMIMVGLPACLGIESEEDALRLRTHFREVFEVEVPLYFRPMKDGEVDCLSGYARISHQIYNRVEDYYKFRDAVNQLVQEGFNCAQLRG